MNSLQTLPLEIYDHISGYSDIRSICNLFSVNKDMQKLDIKLIWKHVLRRDFEMIDEEDPLQKIKYLNHIRILIFRTSPDLRGVLNFSDLYMFLNTIQKNKQKDKMLVFTIDSLVFLSFLYNYHSIIEKDIIKYDKHLIISPESFISYCPFPPSYLRNVDVPDKTSKENIYQIIRNVKILLYKGDSCKNLYFKYFGRKIHFKRRPDRKTDEIIEEDTELLMFYDDKIRIRKVPLSIDTCLRVQKGYRDYYSEIDTISLTSASFESTIDDTIAMHIRSILGKLK